MERLKVKDRSGQLFLLASSKDSLGSINGTLVKSVQVSLPDETDCIKVWERDPDINVKLQYWVYKTRASLNYHAVIVPFLEYNNILYKIVDATLFEHDGVSSNINWYSTSTSSTNVSTFNTSKGYWESTSSASSSKTFNCAINGTTNRFCGTVMQNGTNTIKPRVSDVEAWATPLPDVTDSYKLFDTQVYTITSTQFRTLTGQDLPYESDVPTLCNPRLAFIVQKWPNQEFYNFFPMLSDSIGNYRLIGSICFSCDEGIIGYAEDKPIMADDTSIHMDDDVLNFAFRCDDLPTVDDPNDAYIKIRYTGNSAREMIIPFIVNESPTSHTGFPTPDEFAEYYAQLVASSPSFPFPLTTEEFYNLTGCQYYINEED